jgi:hypothetical protein
LFPSIQASDPTLRDIVIETLDPNHYFKLCFSLGFSSQLIIRTGNSEFIRSICRELWNQEVLECSITGREGELACDPVFDHLTFLIAAGQNYEKEIASCSSHFGKLDSSRLCKLNLEVLELNISNGPLRLKDEESPFAFLRTRFLDDSSSSSLFEFQRFEYLSYDSMQLFLEIIDGSFDLFTIRLWVSICCPLSLSVSPTCRK